MRHLFAARRAESDPPYIPSPGLALRTARGAMAVAVVAGALLLPTRLLGSEQTADQHTDAAPPELTALQADAEAVRELKFKTAPIYNRLKRGEIAPLLRKELLESYTERELESILMAYEKLGLVKSTEGLLEQLVEAWAAELAAFYDQDTGTVHLIDDLPGPQAMRRIAELHELVHALQDQHFDLSALPLDEENHTDRANAAMALIEGDATLATVDYAAQHVHLSVGDTLRLALAMSQPRPAMPYLLQREATFFYSDGLRLARELRRRGGWDALNKAFADPPTSSEQVLHFRQKYLDERDDPTPVALPDCSAAIGEGWALVAEDTLGELYTQVLFRQQLSFLRAGRPSRGWDGDRLHLYRSDDGTGADCVLVWRSVWDSKRDASEFVDAYRKVLLRKLRPPKAGGRVKEWMVDDTQDPRSIDRFFSSSAGGAIVHVEVVDVLVVEAPSVETAQPVVRHVLTADHGRRLGEAAGFVEAEPDTAGEEPDDR